MTHGVSRIETKQVSMANPSGLKEKPPPSMATIGAGLNIKKQPEYDPSTDTALQATISQTRDLAEQLAAKRNVRRGGRQLLSDSRSTTLG